ncbi:MAG: hypothetical protein HYZ42_11110, partial [Bacteroidetes bacterium]|nr:hypothetical protein [Bacteroidota bacterium]
MKKYSIFLTSAVLLILILGFQPKKTADKFHAGDIIFISNPAGQGKAIQLATKSKFTHVGIVLPDEKGKLMVYHAVEPVKRNTISEFLAYSVDGKYDLMRLKDTIILRHDGIPKLVAEAKKLMGRHYDKAFSWSDMEMYCSEFVWKLYKRAHYIELCPLKTLGSFDLTSPIVQKNIKERYGDNGLAFNRRHAEVVCHAERGAG